MHSRLEHVLQTSMLPFVLGGLATGACGSVISGQPPCSLSCPENQVYTLQCQWAPLCGQDVCPSNSIQRSSRECAQSSKQGEQLECCTCDTVLNLRGGFTRFYTPLLSRLSKRGVSSKMKDEAVNLPPASPDLDKWKKGEIVRLRNQARKEDDGLRGVISEVGTLGCTVRLMNEGNMSRFFLWDQLELLKIDTNPLDYD